MAFSLQRLTLLLLACGLLAACGSNSNDTPQFADIVPGPPVCTGANIETQRLFLQQVTSNSAILKWRGEASEVCFGTEMSGLTGRASATATETEHKEALLSDLSPDTRYYYSIGGAGDAPADQYFNTAPNDGELPGDGNTHIWIIGDSGTASELRLFSEELEHPGEAEAVLDGFVGWNDANGQEDVDLFLLLGDNAYREGTDEQWQIAVFDLYGDILKRAAVWPTIGNHEMGFLGGSVASDVTEYQALVEGDDFVQPDRAPYMDIFTLPMEGEAGGVASGTEQYYSFNYGNVHVISLDSQVTIRDDVLREAMKDWLEADLSSNASDWTVVIFHHPPYTRGSHNSDNRLGGIDQPIFDIREQFNPLFEEYGVDLVYSGHTHAYERSYYLSGHTGLSDTFDAATHTELNGSGQSASGQGDEAYTQITVSGMDDKVVYTVAGSSGKIDGGTLDHPAHFSSLNVRGSVILDATANSLTARFIDESGAELDSFTMSR